MSLIFNCENLEKGYPWNENLGFDSPVSKDFTYHFQSSFPAPIKKTAVHRIVIKSTLGQSKVAFERLLTFRQDNELHHRFT